MEKIHFYNTSKTYEASTDFMSKNIIILKFNEKNVPTKKELANGFEILNEHNNFVQAEYPDYKTVYRIDKDKPNVIELSNDDSVYKE